METFLLGAYTRRVNDGIKCLNFDPINQTLDLSPTLSTHQSPTWITLNDTKTLMLTIDAEDGKGGLSLLTKDHEGNFQVRAQALETKASGCHITYLDTYHLAYVSNYHEGSIDVYQVSPNEQTLDLVERHFHTGSSVHANQQSPHVHMTHVSKDGSYLYSCDLGTDKVYTYSFKSDGRLDLVSELSLPAGTGPRHLVIHPTLDILYVIGELNNTTSVVKIETKGKLSYLGQVLNIPVDQVESSAGAAIKINKDGSTLYVSTRFADVITVFEIDGDGNLSHKQTIASGGKTPRDFCLDRDENYLLVPHQDNDVLQVFQIDPSNKALKALDLTIIAPECVNIVSLG